MVSIKLLVPVGSNGSFKGLLPLPPRSITSISTKRNQIKTSRFSVLLYALESDLVTVPDRIVSLSIRESNAFGKFKIQTIIYAASTSLRVFPEYHFLAILGWCVSYSTSQVLNRLRHTTGSIPFIRILVYFCF